MLHHTHLRAHHPNARPGFVFILVLMLLVMGTATVTWMISRSSLQHTLLQDQVNGYTRHHEMLGVRDIVSHWLGRAENQRNLVDYARQRDPVYKVEIPGGTLIIITVRDGQGTILTRLDMAPTETHQEMLIEMVSRLPVNRPDLVRRSGPFAISLSAAPDEILDAIAGEDLVLSDALREMRDIPEPSRADYLQALTRAGIEAELAQHLMMMFATDTSRERLWRIEVEALDTMGPRRYDLLVSIDRNLPTIHEWRMIETPQHLDANQRHATGQ